MRRAPEGSGSSPLRELSPTVRAGRDAGYDVVTAEAGLAEEVISFAEYRDLKRKLVIAAGLAALVFLGSMAMIFPWVPRFLGHPYLLWALATPVQFWAGGRFYRWAWASFRHRTADMNTLVAVGTSAAYFYSVAAALFPSAFPGMGVPPDVSFDTSAVIITLVLFGRSLEARAKGRMSAAIRMLAGLQPQTASARRDGEGIRVSAVEVKAG